jgi:hypothetical protein
MEGLQSVLKLSVEAHCARLQYEGAFAGRRMFESECSCLAAIGVETTKEFLN